MPSRSVTTQFLAEVRWGDGTSRHETLVVSSGSPIPKDVARFDADGLEMAVWRFPHDPFLPGLALATDPEQAAYVLEQLGAGPGSVKLRTRAYRAGRRAVVEVTRPSARIFLKILRPGKVEQLQERHSELARSLPVPVSLGWSKTLGIVALQAMPGRPLRKTLESGSRRLPKAGAIVALLDQFPTDNVHAPRISSPCERAPDHARLLTAVLPDSRERLEQIIDRLAVVKPGPPVAVHGDFHASQILVEGEQVTGLVDVDTAGAGDRADDLAGILGHLSALSLVSAKRANIDRYGAGLIRQFDGITDPVQLRVRVAGVVFGLATGPFRVQTPQWPSETEQRLDLTERWLDAADAVS
jgi:hypothetical protein